jgi:hypothetical protein
MCVSIFTVWMYLHARTQQGIRFCCVPNDRHIYASTQFTVYSLGNSQSKWCIDLSIEQSFSHSTLWSSPSRKKLQACSLETNLKDSSWPERPQRNADKRHFFLFHIGYNDYRTNRICLLWYTYTIPHWLHGSIELMQLNLHMYSRIGTKNKVSHERSYGDSMTKNWLGSVFCNSSWVTKLRPGHWLGPSHCVGITWLSPLWHWSSFWWLEFWVH